MGELFLHAWDATTDKWIKVQSDANGLLKIDPSEFLENPPTEDEAKKAPSSEWAFDHDADVAAHHAKYTDAEAQAACNLNGTLYWSCAGLAFKGLEPDVDDIISAYTGALTVSADNIALCASVNLPDGATVTKAVVYGNEAAEAVTWYLVRNSLGTTTVETMASSVIETEDTGISYATIDNSAYSYFFITLDLDTSEAIYGARIGYTL